MNESVKAIYATIPIGSLDVEGYMLPDGTYCMSLTQAAESVGKDESNARKFLTSKAVKGLLGEDYTIGKRLTVEIESEEMRGQTRFRPADLDEVAAFWLWEAFRGNKKALALSFALMRESLDRRFDRAFQVERSDDEYNQVMSQRVEQLESALERLSEGYATDDLIRQENQFLTDVLQRHGIDPWALPNQDE